MTRRPKYPTSELLAERAAWAERFVACWVCLRGRWHLPLETHEIASKAQAPNKWADARNYFRVCRECHDDVLSWLPEVVQLAMKADNDPDNYDRVFINRIRGRADNAVEEREVTLWRKFVKAVGK